MEFQSPGFTHRFLHWIMDGAAIDKDFGHVPLPPFNEVGDLPEGNYQASLGEGVARFGSGSAQRRAVTDRLCQIHRLAVATGFLDRLLIFGSYVSDAHEPNDVDVVLVMRDDFHYKDCPTEASILFDRARADAELGASVFGYVPLCCLASLSNSSWLFGKPSATVDAEASWR